MGESRGGVGGESLSCASMSGWGGGAETEAAKYRGKIFSSCEHGGVTGGPLLILTC